MWCCLGKGGQCWSGLMYYKEKGQETKFCGLILLSPLLAGIALAIKIEDRGPFFYTEANWKRQTSRARPVSGVERLWVLVLVFWKRK